MLKSYLLLLSLILPITVFSQGIAITSSNDNPLVTARPPKQEYFNNKWAYELYPTTKKLTGNGILVAVADSGISSHVEFNGKNIQGQDFTLSSSIIDTKNHGTGVAGIIGAKGISFTGIAPKASIVVYKIDDGSAMIAPQAIVNAINTLLNFNAEHPSQKITVLNLSYGVSGGGSAALTQAINRAYESGVVVVCPAGNYSFPGVVYPANLSTTIAVGALSSDGKTAYGNSSYGAEVDFIAPGDRVYTTASDGSYTLMSGTSAAAGFVSALAALAVEGYKNKNGEYPTVAQVKEILKKSAIKIPNIPDVKQGNGFIYADKIEELFSTK